MHKSSGYEDTSAEVSREEENVMRNREAWVAFDEDREAARCTIVSVLSHGRMKLELKMPRVLNANINTSAKTCIGVLYAPLFPLPQAGLSEPSPCLLANSARRTSSGRSAIVNTSLTTTSAASPSDISCRLDYEWCLSSMCKNVIKHIVLHVYEKEDNQYMFKK